MVSICVMTATHSHTNKHTNKCIISRKTLNLLLGDQKQTTSTFASLHPNIVFFPPHIRFPSIKDNSTASQKNQGKYLNKTNLWRRTGCCVISLKGSRLNVTPLQESRIDPGVAAHFSPGHERSTEWNKAPSMDSYSK